MVSTEKWDNTISILFFRRAEIVKPAKNVTTTNIFWKSSGRYLQFVIGMAEKLGQTEENCNLGNTKEIDNEVGEKREEEKGNSNISDAYVNTIKYLEM